MASSGAAAPHRVPGLRRRLACFIYEGVLLFGVLMTAGLVYGMLTQQRHALVGMHGLQAFLFVVLGMYFIWFWTHGGQTVAMKTWHIRVLGVDGQPVQTKRALLRYVLSWLWFVPALAGAYFAGLRSGASITAALVIGVLAYATIARLGRRNQYLHDLLSGTQLVVWKPASPPLS